MYFYDVAVDAVFNKSHLTYRSDSMLSKGDLVEVPLRGRTLKACVLDSVDTKTFGYKIKEIEGPVYEGLRIPEREMQLFEWMSRYYHYPLGKLVFDVLPKELKKPAKLRAIEAKDCGNNALNAEQNRIYQNIKERVLECGFSQTLIHGVTGSGKTRIYKSLAKDVVTKGGTVLFMLPEINLTPQLLDDFKDAFKGPLYPYHSGLSRSAKYCLWKRALFCQEGSIVVGVRSSIFLPFKNLALIIIDEEHDPSFKQDDRCAYNARDVAIKKAALYGIPVVLGSATPSLETYYRFKVQNDGYYFSMKNRIENISLPEIRMVDEKAELQDSKEFWPFKEESLSALENALAKEEKAIVFINRLGYAPLLRCRSCGHAFECPNCSITLKFYKSNASLRCNHCSYREAKPEICPDCGCIDILENGFGTERVEEVLKRKFPNRGIARFDRDNITTPKKLEEVIGDFKASRVDILVGTQMISKGHNFKNVNTVVVLGTDSLLNFPDFRINERTYQTLTQVAGRAGRYGKRGSVYVQTVMPDHSVYQIVQKGSFDEFYRLEIPFRETCKSPPFKRACLIYVTSSDRTLLETECGKMKNILDDMKMHFFKTIRILGPRPVSIEKRVNKYTWSFMIDSSDINELHNGLDALVHNYSPKSKVSYKFDVDPYIID